MSNSSIRRHVKLSTHGSVHMITEQAGFQNGKLSLVATTMLHPGCKISNYDTVMRRCGKCRVGKFDVALADG